MVTRIVCQNGSVSVTFPLAKRKELAYNVAQVDAFLSQARSAYDNYQPNAPEITAIEVRRAAFDLAKKGYSARAVDAGLERLEAALAELEREQVVMAEGWEGLSRRSLQAVEEIKNRLSRPAKKRFKRVNMFTAGYRITDVDAFVDEALVGLDTASTLRASWVRQAMFRPQKGGYSEHEVDLILDDLIAALMAAGQA